MENKSAPKVTVKSPAMFVNSNINPRVPGHIKKSM